MGVALVAGGIDEAGYGPKLGPLTMAGFVLALDGDDLEPLHRMFREAFPVTVADSKRLFSPRTGLRRLEENALALLAAGWSGRSPSKRAPPASVRELLERLCPQDLDDIAGIPWYAEWLGAPLPLEANRQRVCELAAAARAAAARCGISLQGALARVLSARRLNDIWRATANKPAAPLHALESIIRLVTDGQRAVLVIDQQGGRRNYSGLLSRLSPGRFWQRRVRGDTIEYAAPDAAVTLLFMPAAEPRHPTVAAASMIAKYTRELLMRGFYGYWRSRGLAACDGYGGRWRDFVSQAAPHLARQGLRLEDLLRAR